MFVDLAHEAVCLWHHRCQNMLDSLVFIFTVLMTEPRPLNILDKRSALSLSPSFICSCKDLSQSNSCLLGGGAVWRTDCLPFLCVCTCTGGLPVCGGQRATLASAGCPQLLSNLCFETGSLTVGSWPAEPQGVSRLSTAWLLGVCWG